MQEISLNILDIVENSAQAGAKHVRILVDDSDSGALTVVISDDGRGMSVEEAGRAFDPFYTTRTTRRVGLGLPLLKDAAEITGGSVRLESTPGAGTTVTAVFVKNHPDCQPMGDIVATLKTLITGYPDIEFHYEHHADRERVVLDTEALSKENGSGFRRDIASISRVMESLDSLLSHFGQAEPGFKPAAQRRSSSEEISQ
jgi:anti-sigma regulatory factor (Ser/Thr protein kinase)